MINSVMAVRGLDYFYDAQMKRFLEQIVRGFSKFKIDTPYGLQEVPCRMALRDRMVANIIANGSENTLNTVPMMTVSMTGLEINRAMLRDMSHVSKLHLHEREVVDGVYTGNIGASYTIERLAPRPFIMSFQLDIWTSNEHQKHQLLEQLLTVVTPFFQIQNSENPLDHGSTTDVMLEGVTYSSRSIPVGTAGSDDLDIATLTFTMPFEISPPARVTKQTLIHEVITNVNEGEYDETGALVSGPHLSTSVVTPDNMRLHVYEGELRLVDRHGRFEDASGNPYVWMDYLNLFGTFRPADSKISVSHELESNGVIGIIHPTNDPAVMRWQIDPDTLPANTLSPVNGVIAPLETNPLTNLPAPQQGDRYILLDDIGPSQAWGQITARAGNIIEYNGASWTVVFGGGDAVQHTRNLRSGNQLRWTGEEWIQSIDGEYLQGYWRIWL